jgi:soluble lytic murein transglycosylase-like protein
MTPNSPILRSAALQKSLALTPVRPPASGTSFATTLAAAQNKPSVGAAPRKVGAVASTPPAVTTVPFKDQIVAAATRYGIDPALLAAVVKTESNFNPRAQSGAGAKGLTQLMDATARGLGVSDPFDPAQSLDAGAKFLGGLLKQFHGDQSLALAAYNAGPGAVQKYGGIPPYQETQRYVPKVLGYAAQFSRIMAAHD